MSNPFNPELLPLSLAPIWPNPTQTPTEASPPILSSGEATERTTSHRWLSLKTASARYGTRWVYPYPPGYTSPGPPSTVPLRQSQAYRGANAARPHSPLNPKKDVLDNMTHIPEQQARTPAVRRKSLRKWRGECSLLSNLTHCQLPWKERVALRTVVCEIADRSGRREKIGRPAWGPVILGSRMRRTKQEMDEMGGSVGLGSEPETGEKWNRRQENYKVIHKMAHNQRVPEREKQNRKKIIQDWYERQKMKAALEKVDEGGE